jgi:chemotaxis protein MotB
VAPESNKPIIIKKVKKGGHGGHHGGSWKVAYADFVTAMMAFFLLMWLINSSKPEQKEALAYYFEHFDIFQENSGLPPGGGAKIDILNEPAPPPPAEPGKTDAAGMDKIKLELAKTVAERLAELKDQVVIDTFEDGVRVQMIYKEGSPLFETGGTDLTPKAKEILRVISESIKELPNLVAIEGHTDAARYSGRGFTNWELSTARASAARLEMEKDGFNPDRIKRVAGYAATEPLITENPLDPRNRRISILIFNTHAAQPEAGQSPEPPQVTVPDTPPPSESGSAVRGKLRYDATDLPRQNKPGNGQRF